MKAERRYKKGLWTEGEDRTLTEYIRLHGKGKWNRIAQTTGLKRSGKSCRLRWVNYLSPTVKHGNFSEEEDDLIIRLHNLLGNRWSLIAGRVPGRTDNQIKNHWNTNLSKKIGMREEIIGSKVGGSSQKLTTFVVAENVAVPMDANWEPPSNNHVGMIEEEKVAEDGSQNKLVGFYQVEQEARVNEPIESPFCLFSNLNTPFIVELWDQYYSLDDQFV